MPNILACPGPGAAADTRVPAGHLGCHDEAMTNPWNTLVTRMGRQKWFASTFQRVAPHADRFLGKATGGRVFLLTGTGIPTLLLTTTGRKSGQQRTVPLLYSRHEGALLVVGSNWGQQHPPAWALNLLADPEATVSIRGKSGPVRARIVEGEERELVWNSLLTKNWPGYENYAERAGRHINIFALEPVKNAVEKNPKTKATG
ncbi:nitroreductase family deazaflavin-dependent oxidoreductase [Catenulispora pinisilvae]|uniref:nitroreductase family deazaflavin-dependent oxidoreductase n=1 Tax=Catenulispora pinisilvae TaxID=2705253 RepID=UPI001E4B43C7|nr:nitroreductase family deazaflavin-dependent oxidoreductase [Catenulispora pinisilvae]